MINIIEDDQIFRRCVDESEYTSLQYCHVCTVKEGFL